MPKRPPQHISGVQLAVSSVDSLKPLITKLGNGEIKVPPPPEGVGNLPFIGRSVKNLWQKASDNLESTLMKFEPQVKAFAKWLLKTIFGAAVGLLMFAISLIIAGVLMASAKSGGPMAKSLLVRLAGDRVISDLSRSKKILGIYDKWIGQFTGQR